MNNIEHLRRYLHLRILPIFINVMIDKKRGLWYNKYYFSENKNSCALRRHGFINERLVKI